MRWDASRTVPWQRLIREWFVYVAIMAALFMLLFSDRPLIGLFAGLLASGPLYLAIGFVLAKLGHQRKSFRELRQESKQPRVSKPDPDPIAGPRPKPAPTRRTGGGRPAPSGRKRKR